MHANQFSFFNVDLIDDDIRPAALRARPPLHRRGLRSLAARTLRRLRCMAPPVGVARGKSLAQPHQSPCTAQTIDIYFANVLSINSAVCREALRYYMDTFTPTVVGMTETWLDDQTKHVQFNYYELISRRIRAQPSPSEQNQGGIQLYRRTDGPLITHLGDSIAGERNWHALHTTIGPILLGLWYRPPNCKEHLAHLDSELVSYGDCMIGTVLIGDMNIHHKKWLLEQ